uniref:Cystatin domain-containing protein n=1 Tax=Angiostrongylus cantonensis TaxID=6313 RepID=A0A0K0D7W6_ANGCA
MLVAFELSHLAAQNFYDRQNKETSSEPEVVRDSFIITNFLGTTQDVGNINSHVYTVYSKYELRNSVIRHVGKITLSLRISATSYYVTFK